MGSRSSKTDPPFPAPAATVVVGRAQRAHGVRGEVEVEVLSDVPGRFAPGSVLWATAAGAAPRRLTVESSRPKGRRLLVRFREIADREAARELGGSDLEVDEEAVPPAPEGVYYHFQLLGCRCRDRRLGALGEVVDVVEDGGGLLLIVEGEGGRQVPVPFVESFLVAVDVDAKTIELDLPPGLVETCASRS